MGFTPQILCIKKKNAEMTGQHVIAIFIRKIKKFFLNTESECPKPPTLHYEQ